MAAPNFSVIIPFYNGQHTLANAIESVLTQAYPHFEIILINDGSTDNSHSVAEPYISDRVRYFEQDNQGVAAARNLGAAKALHPWLCFLDCDDVYYPERLTQHAEWIEQDQDLDVLTADFDYVDANGAHLGTSLRSTPAGQYLLQQQPNSTRLTFDNHALTLFVGKHFGDTHTLTVKRQLFMNVGGYPVQFQVCEDVSLLILVCNQAKKIGAINRPLAAYRIHQQSTTRQNPLFAQQQTFEAYQVLSQRRLTPAITAGLKQATRLACLDLAYCQLKQASFRQVIQYAFKAFCQSHLTLRDFLSITKSAAIQLYRKDSYANH
ncbi:glycosyltransferase family 2 protein [Motilimonas pumila]|uniref:Glycosyltransferase family 2 protein n=1 Tax=Motilimonas pumila TaxID=2303987 RepID=A0A418YJI7_9GAMM|nr:glycosyltransferase family 2 protein [Motilimonas pumila]RJG50644.1 glycosyltransferase family 2 protein [Motilimonas pumila]